MTESSLSHIDDQNRASMVDVGGKLPTIRRAVAEARVRISKGLQQAIEQNMLAKGNLLEVARLAGITAAKRTADLIPLCHNLLLEHVDVQATVAEGCVYLRAEAKTTGKTGVEMEAYTAVAVAALTVIDMGKAVDPAMVIENLRLVEKTGGRGGDQRPHESEFPQ